MTRIACGRPTACAIGAWSGYVVAWAAASGARPGIAVLWWLAGLALLQAIRSSLSERPETASVQALTPVPDAVQDWESEGGAIATS